MATMMMMTKENVHERSEKYYVTWGGEFRGEACIWLEKHSDDIYLCYSIEALRIVKTEGCFKTFNICQQIIITLFSILIVCIEDVEYIDGLPRCFRIKIKVLALGQEINLVNERICLFGILGERFEIDLDREITNKNIDPGKYVMVLLKNVE